MTFAGHARSLDLSHSVSDCISTAAVHPKRHHYISVNQSPTHHARSHSTTQADNYEAYGRNYKDVGSVNRLSFREAVAAGTDDVGNSPSASLWIGNVPPNLADDMLVEVFERFGPIISVRATPYKKCGFVNFEDIDSAVNAWHDCHERDLFNTGIAVYVRYEKPPKFVQKDRRPSLKRKRSSVNSVVGGSEDAPRKPIPTGPRFQVPNNVPPSGPRPQQSSISPPPLRRHDTYRPTSYFEADRPERTSAERQRQSSLPQPNCESSPTKSEIDKRGSLQNHDRLPISDREVSQTNVASNIHSPAFPLKKPPSPSASLSQPSRERKKSLMQGIGNESLASPRSDPPGSSETPLQNELPRLDLKVIERPRAGAERNGQSTPGLTATNVNTTATTTAMLRSITPGQTGVKASNVKATSNTWLMLTNVQSSSVRQRTLPASSAESTMDDLTTAISTSATSSSRMKPSGLLRPKDKFGFERLSHLFVLKDKEDLIAQKARTISPLGRLRVSSREKSVESAATDPTPMVKRLVVTDEGCHKCEVGGPFLKLFKCAMSFCPKKIHSMCGNLIPAMQINSVCEPLDINVPHKDSTKMAQETRIVCDECVKQMACHTCTRSPVDGISIKKCITCLHQGQDGSQITAETQSVTVFDSARSKQSSFAADTTNITALANTNITLRTKEIGVQHDVDEVDEAMFSASGCNRTEFNTSIQAADESIENGVEAVVAAPGRLPSRLNGQRSPHNPATKLEKRESRAFADRRIPNPPIEPRLMRDESAKSKAFAIAAKYKKMVTCPWWKRNDSCARHEDDCMFAHRLTGIESPNGHTVAKDWTCFDHRTPQGCRYREHECLYSHESTGLYVGVDGKASKKHLECYWWRYEGHCRYSDADCACAHYVTGLGAEEPMPKDGQAGRRNLKQPSSAFSRDIDLSEAFQRRRARSPSYSLLSPVTTEAPVRQSLMPDTSQIPLQELSNLPMSQNHVMPNKHKSRSVVEVSVDPRRKRDVGYQSRIDVSLDPTTEDGSIRISPVESTQELRPLNEPKFDAQGKSAPLKSKQPIMNPCKNCSKLIFKAEICTDCLKLGQKQSTEWMDDHTHIAGECNIDVFKDDLLVEKTPKPPDYATPAPKVLKRSRTASNSNLFANKRLRPDITVLRTGTYPSPATNISAKPVTSGHLNRINAEKRARDAARVLAAFEPDSSTIEVKVPSEVIASPTKVLDPTQVAASVTLTPYFAIDTPFSHATDHKHPLPSGAANEDHIRPVEPSLPAHDDHAEALCCSHSVTSDSDSDSDSDTPLASIRNRNEKNKLWSSSTSKESPKGASAVKVPVVPALSRPAPASLLPSLERCSTCTRYHRKCVHKANGEFDNLKCYNWREDRRRLGITHKAHYSEAERNLIMKKAQAFEATLDQDEDMASVDDDNDGIDLNAGDGTPGLQDDGTDSCSSSDEIQISPPSDQAPRSMSKKKASNGFRYQVPTQSFDSLAAQEVELNLMRLLTDVRIPEGMMLVPKPAPKEDMTVVKARMKAKGFVFEDTDTSDDEQDDDYEFLKKFDPRVDPLLHHKFEDKPALTPALPTITKGQGLKRPSLVYHRQMMRNFQLFGNVHKQVDRQRQRQEITAMVQKKDADDILALPQQVEIKMNLAEFVGLQKGKEVEPCLGKVTLPRGKFTRELAFREKDAASALGAWGREKRGVRKERPAFVIGV